MSESFNPIWITGGNIKSALTFLPGLPAAMRTRSTLSTKAYSENEGRSSANLEYHNRKRYGPEIHKRKYYLFKP